jgi:hypothetical protein
MRYYSQLRELLHNNLQQLVHGTRISLKVREEVTYVGSVFRQFPDALHFAIWADLPPEFPLISDCVAMNDT